MLRVIIEDWPYGDRKRKTVLGHMDIVNDGSGSVEVGNYYVRLDESRGPVQYYAGSHKRKLGWWPLVIQAFKWAGEEVPR